MLREPELGGCRRELVVKKGLFNSVLAKRTVAAWAVLGGAYAGGCGSDSETGDPRHFEPGQVGQTLPKGASGAANGQIDFRTGGALCARGEGDCDRDSECAAGLVCGYDNLERFLTGACSGCDACVSAHCRDGIQNADETGADCGGADCGACLTCPVFPNGASDHCSANCRCPAREGDCDGNEQCAPGLVCGTGLGPQFALPFGHDVCVAPHCADRVQNADETGIDCGGADCGTCSSCATTPGREYLFADVPLPGRPRRLRRRSRVPAGSGVHERDLDAVRNQQCLSGVRGASLLESRARHRQRRDRHRLRRSVWPMPWRPGRFSS